MSDLLIRHATSQHRAWQGEAYCPCGNESIGRDGRVIEDGLVNLAAVKPIARLGNMDYTVVGTVFTMHRPVLADLTPPEG